MDFNERNLRIALAEKTLCKYVVFFSKTTSTNTMAYRLAAGGASSGTAVIADSQTGGRGRLKRHWESPAGLNLYASLILRPTFAPALCPSLPMMAGVAVADLLTTSLGAKKVSLKWPNDVYINHKKIAGILAEVKTQGKEIDFCVLGIGLNINMQQQDFPPSLQDLATSMRVEGGKPFSRVDMAAALFENIARDYDILLTEGFSPLRERWLKYFIMMGRRCRVANGSEEVEGEVAGIDELGALLLKSHEGPLHRVLAGDAHIMGLRDNSCF